MTLAEDVNLSEYIMAKDDLSGADIKVRKSRFLFTQKQQVCEQFVKRLRLVLPSFFFTAAKFPDS